MREIEIHEKLRHLTMLQIESLMNKYYNGVKASDIIKEYNIDTTSSKLYTLFRSHYHRNMYRCIIFRLYC